MSSQSTGEDAPRRIRVVFADDSYLVREAVARIMGELDDVELVAACEDGDCLRSAVERENPDVVVLDIRMPPGGEGEGIRIAARLRTTHPRTGVVVLTNYAEPRYGIELMLPSGDGRAYRLKERVHSVEQLGVAIRTVANGGSMIDSSMVSVLVDDLRRRRRSPLADLTARERDVLAEMAQGRSNAAIADKLCISKSAVEKYAGTIFQKLALPDEELVSRRVAAALLYLANEPR